jgi:hypothetical protein
MTYRDLRIYLDSTDVREVAAAARRLDAETYLREQADREQFDTTMAATDEELFAERENSSPEDQGKCREITYLRLQAIRDRI